MLSRREALVSVASACAATGVAEKPTFVEKTPRMVVVKADDMRYAKPEHERIYDHVSKACQKAGWSEVPILVIPDNIDIEFIDCYGKTGKPNGAQPDLTPLIDQRMTFDHIGDRVTGTILAAGLGWSKFDDMGTSVIICAVRLTDGRLVQTMLE